MQIYEQTWSVKIILLELYFNVTSSCAATGLPVSCINWLLSLALRLVFPIIISLVVVAKILTAGWGEAHGSNVSAVLSGPPASIVGFWQLTWVHSVFRVHEPRSSWFLFNTNWFRPSQVAVFWALTVWYIQANTCMRMNDTKNMTHLAVVNRWQVQ